MILHKKIILYFIVVILIVLLGVIFWQTKLTDKINNDSSQINGHSLIKSKTESSLEQKFLEWKNSKDFGYNVLDYKVDPANPKVIYYIFAESTKTPSQTIYRYDSSNDQSYNGSGRLDVDNNKVDLIQETMPSNDFVLKIADIIDNKIIYYGYVDDGGPMQCFDPFVDNKFAPLYYLDLVSVNNLDSKVKFADLQKHKYTPSSEIKDQHQNLVEKCNDKYNGNATYSNKDLGFSFKYPNELQIGKSDLFLWSGSFKDGEYLFDITKGNTNKLNPNEGKKIKIGSSNQGQKLYGYKFSECGLGGCQNVYLIPVKNDYVSIFGAMCEKHLEDDKCIFKPGDVSVEDFILNTFKTF